MQMQSINYEFVNPIIINSTFDCIIELNVDQIRNDAVRIRGKKRSAKGRVKSKGKEIALKEGKSMKFWFLFHSFLFFQHISPDFLTQNSFFISCLFFVLFYILYFFCICSIFFKHNYLIKLLPLVIIVITNCIVVVASSFIMFVLFIVVIISVVLVIIVVVNKVIVVIEIVVNAIECIDKRCSCYYCY